MSNLAIKQLLRIVEKNSVWVRFSDIGEKHLIADNEYRMSRQDWDVAGEPEMVTITVEIGDAR